MSYFASPTRFMSHYVRTRSRNFLFLAVIVVAASACAVGVQLAMKLLVDAMTGSGSIDTVYAGLALFVGLVAAESALWRISGLLLGKTTIAAGVRIRLDLFAHLTGHQIRFFQGQRAGSLGHRITAMAGNFGAISHRMVLDVAPPIISFLGAVIIFASIDRMMAVLLATCFILVTGFLIWLGARGNVYHEAYAQKAGRVGGDLVDVIGNMWAVKAFSAAEREQEHLNAAFREEAAAQRKGWMFVEKIRVLHDIALVVMIGSTLFWAVHLWSRGTITPGDVVVVSNLTFRILLGSRDLAMALVDTGQQLSYMGETLSLLGQPQTIIDKVGAPPLRRGGGEVAFRNVNFGYDPRASVLKNVSIEIPSGQKVGIVGPSGGGKSTMLQLILRLYDVRSGAVLVDGQRVDEVTQGSLRDAVAIVPQDVVLFHRSIMENIRFGRPTATDEDVMAAASAAHCDQFIAQLPDGYGSIVGERGTKLSGGQRQRIGIARAFLKDATIVLLDEATSALDTSSELEVQQAITDLMRNRTVLAVAHRLSTVAAFDRILVVEDGQIVEDGSPKELMGKGGTFDRLWRLQVKGWSVGIDGEDGAESWESDDGVLAAPERADRNHETPVNFPAEQVRRSRLRWWRP
jgi:ATP-binding cassette subfamily B protein